VKVGHGDRESCDAVYNAVEIVGPSPASRASSIIPYKSSSEIRSQKDEGAGQTPIAHGRSLLGMISWMQDIDTIYLDISMSNIYLEKSAHTTRIGNSCRDISADYIVILSAEPEIQEPTTPSKAPPTRNHFFPRRSESEP
jgi:hypothetical protein